MTDLRTFGTTGLSVGPLCLGTSSWGPQRAGETPAEGDARLGALADAFFGGHLGTNFVDTSNMYGDSLSEGQLGAAITRAGGLPGGVVLQTKLDRRMDDDYFGADQMRISLEQSLERLGLSSVQVLYLHDPDVIGFDAAMVPGGPVEALVEMKRQGLAGAIGISGGPVGMMQRFVETDLFDALVTHNRFTLVDRSASALFDAATLRGMGVTNAAPYGAGILTGDPRFAGSYGYRPILPEVQAAVDAIATMCAEAGIPLSAAALQFSMREPRIHSTIVGVSSLERMHETLRDAELVIPEELWARFDEVLPPALSALDMPRS